MISNSDMPAMPSKAKISNDNEAWAYQFDHESRFQFPGMTKREMIAMHISQGLCASDIDTLKVYLEATGENNIGDMLAKMAVEYTDALLKELEKQK